MYIPIRVIYIHMPVKVCVYVHRNRAKALSNYLGILKFELTVSPNEPTNMCNTRFGINCHL